MSSRTNISKKRRFDVFERDGFRCRYCGRSSNEAVLEIDHIIPTDCGGTNELSNLVTSCRDCNSAKGDSVSDSYVKHLVKQELERGDGEFDVNLKFNESEYELLLKVRDYIINNSHDSCVTVGGVLHKMVMYSLETMHEFIWSLEEK